ncbi:hypothetical protein [Sediminibacterium sp.]|uniref:hypothetical protein n=1 Tax=Sediminibacterium sp. TaxID=1917865 RepID=UPI0025F3F321|nr:hypothetical protein [Sediminibacterium sp.]MBW0177479.1 hypothetical protein [Sediminibacterium sp.]
MRFISRTYQDYATKTMFITGKGSCDDRQQILTLVLFIGISAKAKFYSYTGYPV